MNASTFVGRRSAPTLMLGLVGLLVGGGVARAQFTDPFDTISPAWVVNRYAPAAFEIFNFGGDNRLRLTIDATGANRSLPFDDVFYNIQGKDRPGGITGLWTLSAQVYVAASFNTTTGPLVQAELWGHTGTTPAGGDYLEIGFTNASPTQGANPAGGFTTDAVDRAFRFRVFDGDSGTWTDLALPVGFAFDSWHTLSGTFTGSAFEYRLDGVVVHTDPTGAGHDLLSAMIQGYNFGQPDAYSVLWDNVTVSAIPEPSTYAMAAALAALAYAIWRRRSP